MIHGFQTEFGFSAQSHGANRPTAGGFGTTITSAAGADAYGTYAEVMSDTLITEDCYGIMINVNNVASSGSARPGTVTIGKDETGGTTWVDWLTDLVIGNAASYERVHNGIWYYFPMYIKSGTALAAKYASGVGGSIACSVNLRVYGRPKNPGALRVATKFESFGASAGAGTVITSGDASEGAWTAMGSNPSTPLWWWQFGFQTDDTATEQGCYHCDVGAGDATTKYMILENIQVVPENSERLGAWYKEVFCERDVTVNDLIYARAQHDATPDLTLECAVYGVG